MRLPSTITSASAMPAETARVPCATVGGGGVGVAIGGGGVGVAVGVIVGIGVGLTVGATVGTTVGLPPPVLCVAGRVAIYTAPLMTMTAPAAAMARRVR